MIKSVTITNHLSESVKIDLPDGEPKHGMVIRSIDGLGPAKANVNFTNFSSSDGSIYNSARIENRNITIQLILVGIPDIETARQNCYKYFPIKKNIEIVIETDNRFVKTYGYVETNEPSIFSKMEEVLISIVCPNPYLYSIKNGGINRTIFYGVEPMFEFIFENNSLTDNLIEMGSIENEVEKTIFYEGDIEVGIKILIHAIGPASDITIYNIKTREHIRIDTDKLKELTGSGLISGDDIVINTVIGQKSVKLLRMGEYTNILQCIDRDSDWFQLSQGENIFAYTAVSGSENLEFKIENEIIYGGI